MSNRAVKQEKIVGIYRVEGLYGTDEDDFVVSPREELSVDWGGIIGEQRLKRRGRIKSADIRAKGLPKGRPMRHVQHVSIVGVDDLSEPLQRIRDKYELDSDSLDMSLFARALGANILLATQDQDKPCSVSGIPGGAWITALDDRMMAKDTSPVLSVSRYNKPCPAPGLRLAEIVGVSPKKEFAGDLESYLQTARGVVAEILSPSNVVVDENIPVPGKIAVGDLLTAYTV